MHELIAVLSGTETAAHLDLAALQLAGIEYPGLDPEPFLHLLDSHAAELAPRVSGASPADYIAAANHYFFEELGFRGNAENFYDSRNSCLNDVIAERTGIPITLSVVYMEIARRLNRRIDGIGLPGHFLVRYADAFIDPFHQGRLLDETACFALARQSSGAEVPSDPAFLLPVSKQQILIRMMNNLRAIYFHGKSHEKLVSLLDLVLTALPESVEEYKQRAAAHLQLRHFRSAANDLQKYLQIAPTAPDRHTIADQLKQLRRYSASLN